MKTLVLAAALAALAVPAVASAATSRTITGSDLDLSTAAGADTMIARIQGASRIVCHEVATSPVGLQNRYRSCVRRTADSAVARLAAPLVTARFRSSVTPALLATR